MIILPDGFKLIAKFVAGSNLYGTNTPLSDIDTRGVYIPSKKYFFGFMHKNRHFIEKEEDNEYHEIREFLKLATENNPNIIEYLFVPEDKFDTLTSEWKMIIDNKKYFLSKKIRWTFSGYAVSQLKRIKRHRSWLLNPPDKKPERSDFGLQMHRATIQKEQIGAFNSLLASYLKEIGKFHELKDALNEMQETHDFKTMCHNTLIEDPEAIKKVIPVSDNFLEGIKKEKAYIKAKKEWDGYKQWEKNRNPERSILEKKYGYDTKHASHLFRLVTEAEELLTTGNLTFPRPDAAHLLEIRNGKYTYDELIDLCDHEERFDLLYNISDLPRSPDRNRIDKICSIICEHYTQE